MDDLEKLLSEKPVTETPKTPSEESPKEPSQEEKKDPEVLKKEEIKANLDAAIREAQDELKRIRKEKRTVKSEVPEEEELPKINMDDPSAKAWDRHIQEQVSPVRNESEQEKAEVRESAIKDFLKDKPSLSSNKEKLKEVMTEYEQLSKGRISEKTKEGVITYLEKAYASVFHEELVGAARGRRIEQAKADALFSDIAVSKGATAYSSNEEPPVEKLNEEDKRILARWGMSSQEWQEDAKKFK